MSLLTAVGEFTCPVAPGVLPVVGLGFQPKAILFFGAQTNAIQTAFVDLISATTGAGVEGCISAYSQDGVNPAFVRRISSNAHCYSAIGAGGAVLKQATLQSLDPDGFTLNFNIADAAANRNCNYFAMGGSEVEQVVLREILSPVAPGVVAHTGFGFQPSGVLIFTASLASGASVIGPNVIHSFGMADANLNQCATGCGDRDNVIPTNNDRVQRTNGVVGATNLGAPFLYGTLVSMDPDGITINWTTVVPVTQRSVFVLAFRGPRFSVQTYQAPVGIGSQSYTGAGFQPSSMFLCSTMGTVIDAVITTARMLQGATDGTTDKSINTSSRFNQTPSQGDRAQRNSVFSSISAALAVVQEASLVSFDQDGATLNWSASDGNQRYFAMGYFAERSPKTALPWVAGL